MSLRNLRLVRWLLVSGGCVLVSACVLGTGQEDETVSAASSALTPTDPAFALQWGLNNTGQNISAPSGNPVSQVGTPHVDLNLSKAWDITRGSPNVIVAVIDEGMVRTDHEDLSARIFTNTNEVPGDGIYNDHNGFVDDVHGYDFTGSAATSDHATLIAGVIAAATGNAKGGTGVAPNVRILPIAAHYSNPAEWRCEVHEIVRGCFGRGVERVRREFFEFC